MNAKIDTVVQLGNNALQTSLAWSRGKLVSRVFILLLAIIGAFTKSYDALVASGVLLSTFFAILSSHQASHYHDLARTARRKGLLTDSFGVTDTSLGTIDLLKLIQPEHKSEKASASYYSTKTVPGLTRFRENLQETFFFSEDLYRISAKRLLWRFVVPIALVTCILTAIPPLLKSGTITLSHIVIGILLFICELDLIKEYIGWTRAAQSCRDGTQRLENKNSEQLHIMMDVFGDYCAATASAQPVETKLYLKRRNHLESLLCNMRK